MCVQMFPLHFVADVALSFVPEDFLFWLLCFDLHRESYVWNN